VVKQSSV